ncbi:hypothetical protein BGZ61DRAFT_40158 [Ilyonectria robusta]|uniref:uncharacterized protein n=1 Tax=Ilyonectria robusta TaxID=1079257 RepID=UPI001E8DE082|nr:uncharacterized protein BGZ61DRAFT_40158 [Ilyonectria robusta]KAH8688202.1 hypothetical protein BGZ61DRAFT_40158 [Ilyonectria robusta]
MIRGSNSPNTAGGPRQIYFSPSPLLPRPIPSPLTRRRSHHQPASATPRTPGRPAQPREPTSPTPKAQGPNSQTRISSPVANHAPSSLVPLSPTAFPVALLPPPPSSPRGGRRDSAKRVIASPTCSHTRRTDVPPERTGSREKDGIVRHGWSRGEKKNVLCFVAFQTPDALGGRDSAGSPCGLGRR